MSSYVIAKAHMLITKTNAKTKCEDHVYGKTTVQLNDLKWQIYHKLITLNLMAAMQYYFAENKK